MRAPEPQVPCIRRPGRQCRRPWSTIGDGKKPWRSCSCVGEKSKEEEVEEVVEPHLGIDVYIGYVFVDGVYRTVLYRLNMYLIYWLN